MCRRCSGCTRSIAAAPEVPAGLTPLLKEPRIRLHALSLAFALILPMSALAAEKPVVAGAIEEYMDFNEYGSSLIFAEQIPADDWKSIMVIDARDAGQFAKNHIPGARNIEWRQVVGQRPSIPKDRMVVVYCNSGSLSAQSVFAMRLLGWDNFKVLQGGIDEWTAKGGFEANKRASRPAGH